jgi:HK97 family phage portal protein
MKLAVVFRCVDLLSDYLSMLPFFVVDTFTRQKVDDATVRQIRYLLNIRPNKTMTAAEFWKCLEKDRLQHGNGYAQIISAGNGVVQHLEYIQAERVRVRKVGGVLLYDIQCERGMETLLQGEILHFKGISDDGRVGKSVLSYAQETIASMTFQERFAKNFYENGGRPSGILSYETDLSDVIKKRIANGLDTNEDGFKEKIRKDWQNKVSKNPGGVAVLDNGVKYQSVQPISQKDMAFVESKEVNIADIARYFGVPLYLLFTGKESYQSNEQNKIAFVTDKINPIVTNYEQELTYKLFVPERYRNGITIKGNLNVLLRGDIGARANFYEKMRNMGAMSVNDIRGKEDMPDIDGGDVYLASLNYVPLADFQELSKKRNDNKGENTK